MKMARPYARWLNPHKGRKSVSRRGIRQCRGGRSLTKRSEGVLSHVARVIHADQGFRSFPQVGPEVLVVPGSQESGGSDPLGPTREPKVSGVAAIELLLPISEYAASGAGARDPRATGCGTPSATRLRSDAPAAPTARPTYGHARSRAMGPNRATAGTLRTRASAATSLRPLPARTPRRPLTSAATTQHPAARRIRVGIRHAVTQVASLDLMSTHATSSRVKAPTTHARATSGSAARIRSHTRLA